MNSLSITSSLAPGKVQERSVESDSPYAPASHTAALLRSGAAYRRERMEAADMIGTDAAAELAGTSRVTINAWIKSGRAVGVSHLRRGFKLPRWQFEPAIFDAIGLISKSLGTTDGWRLLTFLETPSQSLDGLSPRVAAEQGVPMNRVLALAEAEAH
ncbi:MAG: hypothetical protein WA159_16615 [Variovorax sp.]